MDAFKVHERLIDDYQSFSQSFVEIRDSRLRGVFEEQAARGAQWPDPWLSLNPSFESGGNVSSLAAKGVLCRDAARIFAAVGPDGQQKPFELYRHQTQAIHAAGSGASYVLTTGTGSGKSLSYIAPIVDHVLRHGSGKGIKAIVVYPMNALANSQREELNKFLARDGQAPAVTYERYTGQEDHETRGRIHEAPPDILLTNYVMLELMLTRPDERRLLERHAKDLQFLVLDELHTYRGRQGADVAMLVRRVRDITGRGDRLQCVGTSATMSSGTTVAQQQDDVAAVASRIFGAEVRPENVIVESLVRATTVRQPSPADLGRAVRERGGVESSYQPVASELRDDPLASWVEDAFGIAEEEGSRRLVRRPPTTVARAAELLSGLTGQREALCANAIRATLRAGSEARDPETGRTFFAFRLHQFISKSGALFVTPESPEERRISTEYQLVVDDASESRLYPLAFCRQCGQEYLVVTSRSDASGTRFLARHQISSVSRTPEEQKPGTKEEDGYLFFSTSNEWPVDPIAEGRLPQSWLATSGTHPVVEARRKDVPRRVHVRPDGTASWADTDTAPPAGSSVAAWVPGVFRFCLSCGVTYEALRLSELAKLATLDREGRSSATSAIAASVLGALRDPAGDVAPEAQKLLTFVDNRQDAALQAGHFNDFVQMAQLRAATYAAVLDSGDDGIDVLDLPPAVVRALDVDLEEMAQAEELLNPRRVARAVQNAVEYRVLRDLQKGVRVTLPNLEQTGLVRVVYPDAVVLAERDDLWSGTPVLAGMRPGHRLEIITVLLDELRRVFAIDSEAMTSESFDRLRREGRELISGVLAVSDAEPEPMVGIATVGSGRKGGARNVLHLSGRSAYGKWLRTRPYVPSIDGAAADALIEGLLTRLESVNITAKVTESGTPGYRLRSTAITLVPGDGTHGAPDPVRLTFSPDHAPRVVTYFRDLYREAGRGMHGLLAAEHTAQVRADDREERERSFRSGRLPLLFCSPTMELGVDIASLNAVALRNVPPTPANYAQRSGRAGRSGQQALVVTYCASGNAHDTYYFQRSDQMVAGQVTPPRLDLANEDLVRSHVHAMWLAECLSLTVGGLQSSMSTVLDLTDSAYPVVSELQEAFADREANERARRTARTVLDHMSDELEGSLWWSDTWVDEVIGRAPASFDEACQRWRELYRSAVVERDLAERLAADVSMKSEQRRDADRRRAEARQRIELLLNESGRAGQSDFYTYRYLASEGFLPGYSFPRLPLAAYIPGSRRAAEGAWLQRPRFLAIREFGPGALIYHEGARYQVTRIALPRGEGSDDASQVVLGRIKVCDECGQHHEFESGVDVCCGVPLRTSWTKLLQLQTVITRRRQRISADEEERNRVGFELITTYRFMARGDLPGEHGARVEDADGCPVASVTYGDSAELRVTNLGRVKRKNRSVTGFHLDLVKGRWLSEKEAAADGASAADEDDLEARHQDVRTKERVIPYVQDRRNILVVRWADPVSLEEATTLRYAVERGLEIHFQLEDSELASEALPDPDERGRFLLIESAEGGAGALRRVQGEPNVLAAAARAALALMHVDPETGAPTADACVRGCYRCLLSYGNQGEHEQIDRRLAVPALMRLLRATTVPETSSGSITPKTWERGDGDAVGESSLERYLAAEGHRLPAERDIVIAGVRVDLLYVDGSRRTAVIIRQSADDRRDVTPLVFDNVDVIDVPWGVEIAEVVGAHPAVFGPGR